MPSRLADFVYMMIESEVYLLAIILELCKSRSNHIFIKKKHLL
jgi:hypothetical protein